ncbi:MAG: 30S ribosomal protein S16 [Candidatus Omnitrophica bacterium]|jgi:small subunit ribosomal protein S16|nr:30S ribosomal protein S16 [Candidatus Omnitrophota bacterium]
MAAKIRLVRKGKKNRPFYRIIVVSDEKDGRGDVIEILGHYDPLKEPAEFQIKPERLHYWLKTGAQPSETVKSFIRKNNLIS